MSFPDSREMRAARKKSDWLHIEPGKGRVARTGAIWSTGERRWLSGRSSIARSRERLDLRNRHQKQRATEEAVGPDQNARVLEACKLSLLLGQTTLIKL